MRKILIAGGTGFIGRHLIAFLAENGYILHVLTRNKHKPLPIKNTTCYRWDVGEGFIDIRAFEGVDTIINLTGENIAEKRWAKKRKQELLYSRVTAIELLYRYVTENSIPVQTFISSSATGYYGAITTDTIFNEESERGHDFLGDLCGQWEKCAFQFKQAGARVIILRKGVVLGNESPFYRRIAPFARLGINPAVGSGKQYVPWIAINDLVRMYDFILQHRTLKGVFNAVSSRHITMNTLSAAFLDDFGHRKITPNIPAFLLKWLYGEMAGMLLEGSRVDNQKIKAAGFEFLTSIGSK